MPQVTAVCAHPWAYAASQPQYNITPILRGMFADFSAAGFDAVELMGNVLTSGEATRTVADLAAEFSLPVIGCSFGGAMSDPAQHDTILAEAERTLDALHELGAQTFGVSTGGAPGGQKTDDELDIQCRLLRRLMDMAADRGVLLNLHNHTYEALWGEHEINGNIQRLPDVKLGPDLNWLRRAGVCPTDFLRRHAGRIAFMHLRDQQGECWVEALGDGDEDCLAIGAVLDETGFSGPVAIELAHEAGTDFTRTMGENFAVSCRNLRVAWGL